MEYYVIVKQNEEGFWKSILVYKTTFDFELKNNFYKYIK